MPFKMSNKATLAVQNAATRPAMVQSLRIAGGRECKDRAPLGMNTGQIGKDQLSASSNMASFSNTHLLIRYLPFEGVLGSINSWCSSVTEEKWKDAYFEVCLTH
ncbi:uncharacterized protein LOC130625535 [Hydractinia symbiolongicarpus]|uniref:uncharacterized protein LOC130625535 n=1 Tax=Hydractinia symbiolongicarpus TaxID=13093 RepID=UPI00254A18B6|nr:uncharacterized protein LOC130625535 [Hydractinia symbiolongicarpus]